VALELAEVAALLPVVLALLPKLIAEELSVVDSVILLLLLLIPVVIISEEEVVPDIIEFVAVAIGTEGVAIVGELLGSELADMDMDDIEPVAVAVAE